LTRILACAQKAVNCKLANEIDGASLTPCLTNAMTACTTTPTKVGNSQTAASNKAVLKCGLVPFGDVTKFVGGLGFFNVASGCSAGTVNDLVSCLFADARCEAEHEAFVIDPRANDSLSSLGIAGSFSCLGP
jgi:hypothetical protein